MDKEKIYMEFQERAEKKNRSLNIEEAPYSREEAEAYQEGWRSAWAFAISILADIVTGKYEEVQGEKKEEDAPRDGREKNLYRVFNGIGTFYIVSRSFNEAAEILRKRLDAADYGFTSKREATSVELMATESFMNGKPFFCGDNDRLIVEE